MTRRTVSKDSPGSRSAAPVFAYKRTPYHEIGGSVDDDRSAMFDRWNQVHHPAAVLEANTDDLIFPASSSMEDVTEAFTARFPPKASLLEYFRVEDPHGRDRPRADMAAGAQIHVFAAPRCFERTPDATQLAAVAEEFGPVPFAGGYPQINSDVAATVGMVLEYDEGSRMPTAVYSPKKAATYIRRMETAQAHRRKSDARARLPYVGIVRCDDIHVVLRELYRRLQKSLPGVFPYPQSSRERIPTWAALRRLLIQFDLCFGDYAHRTVPAYQKLLQQWKTHSKKTRLAFSNSNPSGYCVFEPFMAWLDTEVRGRQRGPATLKLQVTPAIRKLTATADNRG